MTAVHHLQTLALVLAACVGLLTGEPARALEPNQQAPELDVKLLNGKTIKAKKRLGGKGHKPLEAAPAKAY